jgi:hypothetical protein
MEAVYAHFHTHTRVIPERTRERQHKGEGPVRVVAVQLLAAERAGEAATRSSVEGQEKDKGKGKKTCTGTHAHAHAHAHTHLRAAVHIVGEPDGRDGSAAQPRLAWTGVRTSEVPLLRVREGGARALLPKERKKDLRPLPGVR